MSNFLRMGIINEAKKTSEKLAQIVERAFDFERVSLNIFLILTGRLRKSKKFDTMLVVDS